MRRIHSLVLLGALAVAGAGCGDPLVGAWQQSQTGGGVTVTQTFTLANDHTATLTIAGSGSCSGMQVYQGIQWSSTATTITFSGQASCNGGITCTVGTSTVNIDCSQTQAMQQMMNGACSYVLSNNNNSLTISACSGDTSGMPQTYTRTE